MTLGLVVAVVMLVARGQSAVQCAGFEEPYREFTGRTAACANRCVLTVQGTLDGGVLFVPESGDPVRGDVRPLADVVVGMQASEVRSVEPLQLSARYSVTYRDAVLGEVTTLAQQPAETVTLDEVRAGEGSMTACGGDDSPFPAPPRPPQGPHRVTRERTDVYVGLVTNLQWLAQRQPTIKVQADMWLLQHDDPVPVMDAEGNVTPRPLLESVSPYVLSTGGWSPRPPVEGSTKYRVAVRLVDSLGRSTPIVTSAEFKTSPASHVACTQGSPGLWPLLLVVLARRRRGK